MIERRESELIAQDQRNQAKRRQTKSANPSESQTPGQVKAQVGPKSAQRRAAANTPYNK